MHRPSQALEIWDLCDDQSEILESDVLLKLVSRIKECGPARRTRVYLRPFLERTLLLNDDIRGCSERMDLRVCRDMSCAEAAIKRDALNCIEDDIVYEEVRIYSANQRLVGVTLSLSREGIKSLLIPLPHHGRTEHKDEHTLEIYTEDSTSNKRDTDSWDSLLTVCTCTTESKWSFPQDLSDIFDTDIPGIDAGLCSSPPLDFDLLETFQQPVMRQNPKCTTKGLTLIGEEYNEKPPSPKVASAQKVDVSPPDKSGEYSPTETLVEGSDTRHVVSVLSSRAQEPIMVIKHSPAVAATSSGSVPKVSSPVHKAAAPAPAPAKAAQFTPIASGLATLKLRTFVLLKPEANLLEKIRYFWPLIRIFRAAISEGKSIARKQLPSLISAVDPHFVQLITNNQPLQLIAICRQHHIIQTKRKSHGLKTQLNERLRRPSERDDPGFEPLIRLMNQKGKGDKKESSWSAWTTIQVGCKLSACIRVSELIELAITAQIIRKTPRKQSTVEFV